MDAIDTRIVDALATNARTTTADLARTIGLSSPSVAERVKRLEEAGVITGYHAAVAPAALGLPVSAWLRIRPVPGALEKVAALIQDIPEIVACDRITGEDCFLAKAHVASVGDLERVIDRIIPYAMTNTSVIQSSPVTRVSRHCRSLERPDPVPEPVGPLPASLRQADRVRMRAQPGHRPDAKGRSDRQEGKRPEPAGRINQQRHDMNGQ